MYPAMKAATTMTTNLMTSQSVKMDSIEPQGQQETGNHSMEAKQRCGVCHDEFPLTPEYWHRHARLRSGFANVCKPCAIAKSREWHSANREKANKRSLEYAASHREKKRQGAAKWFAENKERHLKRCAEYRKNNPEKSRSAVRRWMSNNKERMLAIVRSYKARKRSAAGRHTGDDVKLLFSSQKGKCAACRLHLKKYHVDHIMPLILGGTNDAGNLQLLCPTCNCSKGGKHPIKFAASRGLLF
jgi:HNH endonuclease